MADFIQIAMETKAGYGYSALHAAVISHDLLKLTSLVREGYDPDVRDSNDFTPLHVATLEGSREIVETLVGEGCDINAYTKVGSGRAIYVAGCRAP